MKFFSKLVVVIFSLFVLVAPMSFGQQSQLDSLRTIFENEKIDSTRLDIGFKILKLLRTNEPKEALVLADLLLSEEKLPTLPIRYCHIAIAKMQILNRLSRFDEAMLLGEEIKLVVDQNNLERMRLSLVNEMGNSYQQMSAFQKAADAYYQAFVIAESLGNINAQIISLNNVGTIYLRTKEFKKSEEMYLQALEIARTRDQKMSLGMVLTNLGNLENERLNLSNALNYFTEALMILRGINMKYGVGLVLNSLGYTELQMRNYDKALQYLEESEAIKKEIGDQTGLLSTYVNKGNVFKEQGKLEQAISLFVSTKELAKQIKNPKKLEEALTPLVEIYEKMDEGDLALSTYKELVALKDSLYQVDLKATLQTNKTKIDSTFYRQRIKALEQEKSAYKTKSFLIGTLVLLFMVAILIVWYKIYRKRKNQVSTLTAVLSSKEDAIRNEKFASLKESLKEGALDAKFWIEFALAFDDMHPNFSKTLTQQYPKITRYELRICALVRLGLNNFELSECLNITAKSARTARYRIYKKMDLATDKAFVRYLYTL